MTDVEKTDGYIRQFIASVGVDPLVCYDPASYTYYLTKGTARIEVFLYPYKQPDGVIRNYLRIFSHVANVPEKEKESFYRRLLELSDNSLGVKLTLMQQMQEVYATFERDVMGISAEETATCIRDLGEWADYFNGLLAGEFPLSALKASNQNPQQAEQK